jgi:hypothetical protein
LTSLSAATVDTELWSLNAKASLGDVTKLKGIEIDFGLSAPDGKSLLTALNLDPIDPGPFGFSFRADGEGKDLKINASLGAGRSQLEASFESLIEGGAPIIGGLIRSDRLWIEDIQKAVASAAQLASLRSAEGEEKENGQSKSEEPLVLEKIEEPLVLEKAEEPLVLGGAGQDNEGISGPGELLSFQSIAAKTDLDIAIEIEKIEGQQGVTSVQSVIEAKDGQARFGPLNFSYGGGSFTVNAGVNVIESPDLVTISGTTSGWDIGTLFKTAGIDLDARGKLRADFDVTGNRASPLTYVSTMSGSAFVSMSNGAIGTSLIELAGLGIFPWLFSNELGQGYSKIVCAVAPLSIRSGRVSTNAAVLETERVQMVIAGSLDWKNETISMRAEPRPVGRPLARSAWPIDISGSLRKPKVDLQVGGSRPQVDQRDVAMPAERVPCKPDISQLN